MLVVEEAGNFFPRLSITKGIDVLRTKLFPRE